MKLVIIGSGNVANVLGRRLSKAGHDIMQVAGRNHKAVQSLANLLHSSACFNWNNISPEADIYIVALADSALYKLPFKTEKGVVVHTAGSVPTLVLDNVARAYGVLYPLQTLNKADQSVREIPFLVNGNTPETVAIISQLASTISSSVAVVRDEQRAKIHLAATIVNNFSNHLFALAYNFCAKEDLDFSLLSPLIARTAELVASGDPSTIQTGPAARKDMVTIDRHELMLQNYPGLKQVYEIMSESIIRHREKDGLS